MIDKARASFTRHNIAAFTLFMVGVLLRLRQYLTGRSLWVDEAMLALNIVNRDILGLFKPLDYDQGAPLGFLLVEKIFNLLFGRNEYALRLFPFLLGILSIWLFYQLLKRLVQNETVVLIALALFVISPRLIYYSSEVKQYIVDVVVTIALLLIASPIFEGQADGRRFVRLALVGLVALWFSHPALFVLAGIGLALVIVHAQRRDASGVRYVIGTGVLWVANIGFLYLLILNDLQNNAYMKEYWHGGFMPLPPWSDPAWFIKVAIENIRLQYGFAAFMVYPAAVLMLVGWLVLWKRYRNYAMAIGLILLTTLIASAFQLYPVLERMILFTIPLGLILIGVSLAAISETLSRSAWLKHAVVLSVAAALLYGPLTASAEVFVHPKYFEHIRPAMSTIRDTWKDGDVLFVTNGAVPAFEYYAPMYGLDGITYVSTQRQDYQNVQNIVAQLEPLKGQPRVWVLMSHVYENSDFNEKSLITEYFKKNGMRKREFRMPGTSVYLYLFEGK